MNGRVWLFITNAWRLPNDVFYDGGHEGLGRVLKVSLVKVWKPKFEGRRMDSGH